MKTIQDVRKEIKELNEEIRENDEEGDYDFAVTDDSTYYQLERLQATLSAMIECKKEEIERLKKLKDFINDWYGKRRGNEQKALNEFVQRHVIDELQNEIEKEISQLQKEIGSEK